jgi:hypothetical protein
MLCDEGYSKTPSSFSLLLITNTNYITLFFFLLQLQIGFLSIIIIIRVLIITKGRIGNLCFLEFISFTISYCTNHLFSTQINKYNINACTLFMRCCNFVLMQVKIVLRNVLYMSPFIGELRISFELRS